MQFPATATPPTPASAVSAIRSSVPVTYQGALHDYLVHPDEAALQQAYELGRAALSAGLGDDDLIRLHHQAITDGVLPNDGVAAVRFAPALASFLLAALAPFEAAHRASRGAERRSEEFNRVLAARNVTLALSNAQLGEEMGVRQAVEAALRENKDRYFQLFQEARAVEENLHELSARVLAAQEEERKRISAELHDEVCQALTAVILALALLKKQVGADPAFQPNLHRAEQLLARSMERVVDFARELRPASLDHLGVESALRAYVTDFGRQTGIRTALIVHPDLARFEGKRGETLFRVAEEALNNIGKHAKATMAKIEFTSADGALGMEITDNGCAFDLGEKPGTKRTGRLGLLGMQERVRHLSGSFAIESVPGQGTRVRTQIPFHPEPKPLMDSASADPFRHEENLCAAS